MVSETTFRKSERLRQRREFVDLSIAGKKNITKYFIVCTGTTHSLYTRIGITVSRKVGNAVCRNRLKRMIREFFRNNKSAFGLTDFNVIARSGANQLTYASLCQELANAISRIGQQRSN